MAESTGKVAVTMHHLLEIRQEEQEREEEEELKLSTDLVIVDECSMVSMQLLYALLKALDKGTRLVLIGDCDQLPSVQAGNVFADLIGSQVFPVTYLTKTFRQKQGSAILTNASCVNRGRGRFLWNTDCMLCQTWQERGYTGRSAPGDPRSAKTGDFLKSHAGAHTVSEVKQSLGVSS